jgi:peptidoglycan/xylan/chitin deacetylase (PgdA/CDA1 family)
VRPVGLAAALAYRQPPVLMYHRLTTRTGEHPCSLAAGRFRGQLALLRRLGYRSVSPVAMARWLARGEASPRRVVAITFDDGYLDTLTVALPLLQTFGFTATCYAVSGAVGGRSGWTEPAPLMDWPAMRAWVAAGMAIGSHSETHPDLRGLDPRRLERELAGSRARLEDGLGVPIESFAYPYNRLDAAAVRAVAAAGYAAGAAGVEIWRSPHALCRTDAAHDSPWWFRVQLRPAHVALHAGYRTVVPRRGAPAAVASDSHAQLGEHLG